MVIWPQVLQAGASLCILLAAGFTASRPLSTRANGVLGVLGCWEPDAAAAFATILTSLNSGVFFSYSREVGISSHSSVPVLLTSGLSSTCTRSVLPRYS